MDKIPFQLTVNLSGDTSQIGLIGVIGSDDDFKDFRTSIEAQAAKGITKAHLYINSLGGSVFDANEIVNILEDNFNEITGDGGAIVASAAAFIAAKCKTFTMPANGLFMIHPVRGKASGTSAEIESYLNMMNNMNAVYLEAFKKKAKNPEDLQAKWESGTDYWMNAKSAKEAGFITSIRAKIKPDQETSTMLRACADSTLTAKMSEFLINNDTEMKGLAQVLNLKDGASEQEMLAAVQATVDQVVTLTAQLETANGSVTTLTSEKQALQDKLDAIELAEKEAKKTEAKTLIATAIKDGRLDDDEKHTAEAFYLRNFEADFDGTKAMLENLPKKKDLRDELNLEDKEGIWDKRQKEIAEKNK